MVYETVTAPTSRIQTGTRVHQLRYIVQPDPNLIRWLQSSMNRLLGTRLQLTGSLTANTVQAIVRLQRQLRLPANGRISNLLVQGTRRLLNERIPPPPPYPPGMRPPRPSPPTVRPPRPPYPPSGGTPPMPGGGGPSTSPQPPVCRTCGGQCTTLDRFAFNKTQLTSRHIQMEHSLLQKISRKPSSVITLTGHTDKVGTDAYNFRLGMNRAIAVGLSLLRSLHSSSTHPIRHLTLRFKTDGEKKPVSTTNNALNRRVQVCIN